MKKIVLTAVLGMFAVMAMPFSASADVTSLRGDLELDADSKAYEKRKQVTQKGGFDRSFKLQPPMIPHKVDKDKITLKTNTCMRCHSAANYKKEKAPMTGESHFLDRDGNKLKKVSARRYFCNQCHALQQSADPLVENQFVGAK